MPYGEKLVFDLRSRDVLHSFFVPMLRVKQDAVPGMTGLWQVSGKNRLTFNEMARLDIRYARRSSLWLDLAIIMRTPLAILGQIVDGLRGAPPAKGGVNRA